MKSHKDEGEQQKPVVTRYEKRLEKRRVQAKEKARHEKIMNLSFAAVGLAILAIIAAMFVVSSSNKNKAVSDTFIKVGDHEITKVEYNYFYSATVRNYINTYSSILPYMGLDTNVDFASQTYSETMSWKDAFDEMTVAQIIQTKSVIDDAAANGFSPDITEAYNEYTTTASTAASSAGKSLSVYYRESFGAFATKENMEPFIKESLLAEAYYNDLIEQNAPADEEVTSYYEENKNNYDKLSYRSFAVNAELEEDASEEKIAEAMELSKAKAEEMADRRKAGADFRELCLEYAAEEDKATYENEEADGSLTQRASYSAIPSSYQDWLYDDSRVAGEITVVVDESNNRYYVVEFVEKVYDETTNDSIISLLAGEKVNEYIAALSEPYEVVDVAGELVYLTIKETVEETAGTEVESVEIVETAETEEAIDTVETEEAAETTEKAE